MYRVPLAAWIGLCLATCAWAQPQTPAGKPAPVSESLRLTARASNEFACDLFKALAKDKAGKNVFFSPWSISSALAMTMEGARTDSAAEIGQVLRLPKDLHQGGERPWRLDPYHTGFAEMKRRCTAPRDLVKYAAARKQLADWRRELDAVNLQLLRRDTAEFRKKAEWLVVNINRLQGQIDQFELNVANAIWGEQTYPFDPNYVEAVASHYGTGLVRAADFKENFPNERRKINHWVEAQTKEKIKDLIPDIPPDEARLIRMILVNAIYFKGQWSEPFEKKWTKDAPFLLADGTKKTASLMMQNLAGRYAAFRADGSFFETPLLYRIGDKMSPYPGPDGFMIADVPYKGNRLTMTVILPSSPGGLAAIEKQLSGATLNRWLGHLQARQIQVKLPKFRMETNYELGPALGEMGMKKAFTPRIADFTGMSKSTDPKDRLYISRVIHKAFVDVNEEGTEAAAATAVIAEVNESKRLEPFIPEFHADRPFLFLIREADTGAVLFMGRMATAGK